jgi:phage repressor protein C with HTH and peptisase S24 domain
MTALGAKNESALARSLEILPQSIAGAKKKRMIPPRWIEYAAEKYMINANWLFFGTGPVRQAIGAPQGGQDTTTCPIQAGPSPDCELVMIPKVKTRLSAGGGSLETSGEVDGRYAFRADYINRKGSTKDMVLMDVAVDSMAPEIKDGDMVLIDQSQNQVVPGGIFAVGIDDDVVVKYVDRIPGKIVLISKNKDYAPIAVELRGDLAESVRIIGRVLWWCREAK